MAVSRESVLYGFRFFLGRYPDSERAIELHMALEDEDALVRVLVSSQEFLLKNRSQVLFPKAANTVVSSSGVRKQRPGGRKFLVFGNCQVVGIARMLEVMCPGIVANPLEALPTTIQDLKNKSSTLSDVVQGCDLVFTHFSEGAKERQALLESFPELTGKIRMVPPLVFGAFQPDNDYVFRENEGPIGGPLGHYQSALVFYAWKNGYDKEIAARLFCEDIYRHVGYFDGFDAAKSFLLNLGKNCGLPLDGVFSDWMRRGCFMHSINHPKLYVLADIARLLLERVGLEVVRGGEEYLEDNLSYHGCWPVYPEIGREFGIAGSYLFKRPGISRNSVELIGLEEFVEAAYKHYSQYHPDELRCNKLEREGFKTLDSLVKELAEKNWGNAKGEDCQNYNPYQGLKDYQFWRRGIERVSSDNVDPVVRSRFSLRKEDKVATAGSCFAQHISRTLTKNGFNYFVPENGAGLPDTQLISRNFGVFSARFGNIYTARQLIQMAYMAYGRYSPVDVAWQRPDGRYVDPFRPQVEPDGYLTPSEVIAAREEHLAFVRQMFEELDVMVFTLGLTESWRRKSDGAVFPLAPGVVAGGMNPALYEFINFTQEEVVSDTQKFVDFLGVINPRARVILTVSPVPLIATYEDRHVLVSTTYSKSALRAAADDVVRRNEHVDYFPSYEIITANFSKGAYYEDDLRSVRPEGVEHVMRLFLKHYAGEQNGEIAESGSYPKKSKEASDEYVREASRIEQVICDEEALDR